MSTRVPPIPRPSRHWGGLTKGLIYQKIIAKINLSTLGVAAAQLPNYFQTHSDFFSYPTPTTGESALGFGDVEGHEHVATRSAGHFSYSKENKQSQPGTDSPDVLLRLSDGFIIFTPNLVSLAVSDAVYKLFATDGGIKYHGLKRLRASSTSIG